MTSRILASLAKEWRKWDAENTDAEEPYDGYYEKKRKDSQEMTLLLMWLMLIAIGVGSCYCTYKWITHKCPEPGSVQTVQKGE
jgi:hypothetical protein